MKTITKKQILIIALLALVSLMIAPVMVETLTGTLGVLKQPQPPSSPRGVRTSTQQPTRVLISWRGSKHGGGSRY